MQEVVYQERKDDQSADHHGFCRDPRLHISFLQVRLWTCLSTFHADLDRRDDVEHETGDQEYSDDPKDQWSRVQESGVRIDRLRACEHLQISGEMTEDV